MWADRHLDGCLFWVWWLVWTKDEGLWIPGPPGPVIRAQRTPSGMQSPSSDMSPKPGERPVVFRRSQMEKALILGSEPVKEITPLGHVLLAELLLLGGDLYPVRPMSLPWIRCCSRSQDSGSTPCSAWSTGGLSSQHSKPPATPLDRTNSLFIDGTSSPSSVGSASPGLWSPGCLLGHAGHARTRLRGHGRGRLLARVVWRTEGVMG